ncbi:hypothetical protein [Mesorhizobium loti]|uniref:hypothetical protein n=1 Tax=Rhizobium loti TaxID=381 RepID=UPI001268E0DB|nr:hypothetical protein [Mesorhizobium loti]
MAQSTDEGLERISSDIRDRNAGERLSSVPNFTESSLALSSVGYRHRRTLTALPQLPLSRHHRRITIGSE